MPGWTELKDSNNPYSVTKKEDAHKKTTQSTLAKTGAQQMGITSQTDNVPGGLANLPEHKQKAMMESYAAFYGAEDDPKVSKLSYNKLYQASRERNTSKDPLQKVDQTVREDPAFKQAQKRFFQNEVSDTASQYNAAAAKFYDGGASGKLNPGNTIGNKFQGVQDQIVPANMEGERYKVDQAKFYGDEAEVRSQGSVFQANKQAFYGQDKGTTGFKIQAKAPT